MKFLHARILTLVPLTLALSACGEPSTSSTSDASGSPSAEVVEAYRPETPPNILVFLMDTQRADYLGLYGHEENTSPNLDAFAQESLVFERAYAPASSTSPSHASLFTSTYPRTHGVWNRVPMGEDVEPIYPALSPRAVTLAEVLEAAGYDTAAICDGGNLQENRGFSQGFRTWDSKFLGAHNRVNRALRWIDTERQQDRPFFLFLHTYQVHTPYLPDAQYVEMFADPEYQGGLRTAWQGARAFWDRSQGVKGAIRKIQGDFYKPHLPKEDDGDPPAADVEFVKDLYRAEIRQMDDAFGKLMIALEERGITPENTLFLLTSDHGEEFWEHGKYGHHQIYDSVSHIPFIVRGPGVPEGGRRQDIVDLLDVMPTLLHWSHIEPDFIPASLMGRTLDWGTTEEPAPYVHIGETNWPEHQMTWRTADRKAMRFPDSDRPTEVYAYGEDPAEARDLAAQEEAWLQEIEVAWDAWAKRALEHQKEHAIQPTSRDWARLSQEERDNLIGLGYAEGN